MLVHPHLDAVLQAASLQGVAPATIVTGADDDGSHCADRLRAAGVAVEELRHDPPGRGPLTRVGRSDTSDDPMIEDLVGTLRRALDQSHATIGGSSARYTDAVHDHPRDRRIAATGV